MKSLPTFTFLAVALLAAPLLSGCVVLAGAGLGYVVSQEVLPGAVHETQVSDEVDGVWTSVKETVEILQDVGAEATIVDFPRKLTTAIDGAGVTIEVEAQDIDRTLIRVTAEKFLGADSDTAEKVMSELLRRLSI